MVQTAVEQSDRPECHWSLHRNPRDSISSGPQLSLHLFSKTRFPLLRRVCKSTNESSTRCGLVHRSTCVPSGYWGPTSQCKKDSSQEEKEETVPHLRIELRTFRFGNECDCPLHQRGRFLLLAYKKDNHLANFSVMTKYDKRSMIRRKTAPGRKSRQYSLLSLPVLRSNWLCDSSNISCIGRYNDAPTRHHPGYKQDHHR